MAGKYTAQTFVKIMSKIQAIAIKSETGEEYLFNPVRMFQQDKDKIDMDLADVEDGNKYADRYKIRLAAVAKFCAPVEKVVEKKKKAEDGGFQPIDALTEFAEFTIDNEGIITTAFAYLINSQQPSIRFLDR